MPSEIPRRVSIQGPGFVIEASWNPHRHGDLGDMLPAFERALMESLAADAAEEARVREALARKNLAHADAPCDPKETGCNLARCKKEKPFYRDTLKTGQVCAICGTTDRRLHCCKPEVADAA